MKFVVTALILLFSAQAFAQSDDALAKGEIFVKMIDVKGSKIPKGTVTAVVDSPVEKVFEVVSNCNKFKQRMGQVKEAKTLKVDGKAVTCEVVVDLPWPIPNLRAKTLAQHQEGPKEWHRKWKLLEGDYNFNKGAWILTRFKDDPKRTLVKYWVHADPKTPVPAGIRKAAQKGALKKMIKSIRKSAAKL